MSKLIRLHEDVLDRLFALAAEGETPQQVIERLLDRAQESAAPPRDGVKP